MVERKLFLPWGSTFCCCNKETASERSPFSCSKAGCFSGSSIKRACKSQRDLLQQTVLALCNSQSVSQYGHFTLHLSEQSYHIPLHLCCRYSYLCESALCLPCCDPVFMSFFLLQHLHQIFFQEMSHWNLSSHRGFQAFLLVFKLSPQQFHLIIGETFKQMFPLLKGWWFAQNLSASAVQLWGDRDQLPSSAFCVGWNISKP